ncbi:uncharacterized protein LOC144141605 [Haemaphysalis longicornis]
MRRARGTGPSRSSAAEGALGTPSADVPTCFLRSMHDWSDDAALAAACDVLQQSGGYPTEASRRALYKQWLATYASEEWDGSFDELMLLCIAYTPSPTSPTEPLFKDCFNMAVNGSWEPVLRTVPVRKVFSRHRLYEDELPASWPSNPFCDFLYDLLTDEGKEALNEAGLLISFCSLLMCAACVEDAHAVFVEESIAAPRSIFPTGFVGRVPCPSPVFLRGLKKKTTSRQRLLLPYAVALPVAQYVLLKKAGEDAPQRDLAFMDSAFLAHTRFIGLKTVDVLRRFAGRTGRSMRILNTLVGGKECEETRTRVENYLRKSAGPGDVVHISLPWCRVVCCDLFQKLEIKHNVAYNLRILCFLKHELQIFLEYLHTIPAFAEVTQADLCRARLWANNFRVLLSKGMFCTEDGAAADT